MPERSKILSCLLIGMVVVSVILVIDMVIPGPRLFPIMMSNIHVFVLIVLMMSAAAYFTLCIIEGDEAKIATGRKKRKK